MKDGVPLVRIIDDDAEVCDSLSLLLECAGYEAEAFPSAEAFLKKADVARPGCILSDIRMPGMSGLELQAELGRRGIGLPLIFVTGHGDIEMAADAILAGAFDFLVKPVKEERLFAALTRALEGGRAKRGDGVRERIALLSERERKVLGFMLEGLGTAAVAERLGISERTVQGHRWRVYQKLGLNSPEALRQAVDRRWLMSQ